MAKQNGIYLFILNTGKHQWIKLNLNNSENYTVHTFMGENGL